MLIFKHGGSDSMLLQQLCGSLQELLVKVPEVDLPGSESESLYITADV